MSGAGWKIRRIAFKPEHKLRVRENPPERHFDAGVEGPTVPAGFVAGHQRSEIVIVYGTAKRPSRQSSKNLSRAGRLIGRSPHAASRSRMTGENPGAAAGFARPRDAVRTENFDARQMRNRRVTELNAGLKVGCRGVEPL